MPWLWEMRFLVKTCSMVSAGIRLDSASRFHQIAARMFREKMIGHDLAAPVVLNAALGRVAVAQLAVNGTVKVVQLQQLVVERGGPSSPPDQHPRSSG